MPTLKPLSLSDTFIVEAKASGLPTVISPVRNSDINMEYYKTFTLADIANDQQKDIDSERLCFLRNGLLKAFDEGGESPYDLREGIVESILTEMDMEAKKKQSQKEDTLSLQLFQEYIASQLPQDITKLLQQGRVWLCGGSLLRILTKPKQAYQDDSHLDDPWGSLNVATTCWSTSDWDFFCNQQAFEQIFSKFDIKLYPEIREYIHPSLSKNISKVYTISPASGRPINVIVGKFSNLNEILDGFDLQLTQVGFYYDESEPQFYARNVDVISDIVLGAIRLNSKINFNKLSNHQQIKTKNRINKYVNRGFRDLTGLQDTGLLAHLSQTIVKNLSNMK